MQKRPSRRRSPPRTSAKRPKKRAGVRKSSTARLDELEKRVAALEATIAALTAAVRPRRGPPPLPNADVSAPAIDVSDIAELIETTHPSRI